MLQQHILEAPWPRGRTIVAAGSDNCSCLSCSRRRAGTRMDLDISSRHGCCLVRTPQPFPPSGITTSDHVIQVRPVFWEYSGRRSRARAACMQCKSAFCGRIILSLASSDQVPVLRTILFNYIAAFARYCRLPRSCCGASLQAHREYLLFNPQRPLVICFSWTVANAQGQPASPTD